MRSSLLVVAAAACGDPSPAMLDAAIDAAIDAPDPCSCAYAQPTVAGNVAEAGATELSGITASRTDPDLLWTHNDSGDTARLFAITSAGASRGQVVLDTATAIDWEDITIGSCDDGSCLYVADIGDNAMARASVRIYEVTELTQGNGVVTPRVFDIAYPDGAHNAESLVFDPRDRSTYVITKQATNPSTVFRMPRVTGTTGTAVAVGTLTIPSGSLLATGADLFADECSVRLLVRTTTSLWEWRAAPTATIAELVAGTPASVPAAPEMQGEAVAYLPDGRGYLTVSEGVSPPLHRAVCE